ncbi:MAG: sigma 54-interacting transcriptional regulator [Planctomycetia bacterium]|nr:sigma 54-interacting transcriptional regulator [Planctomycetia bacterium]
MSISAYLIFRDENRFNEVYRLIPEKTATIGRAPANTIVLKDDRCSRAHAEINYYKNADAWFVRDLGSRNGTVVNGKKINPSEEYRLFSSDLLQFGKTPLLFVRSLSDLPSGQHDNDPPITRIDPFEPNQSPEHSSFESSHVLSQSGDVTEETMITLRRDKTRIFETVDLERPNVANTTGRNIRRSIASLCRLALEINRKSDLRGKLELALQTLLRELPVNHAGVLLFPEPLEKNIDIHQLEPTAALGPPGTQYQRVSDYLAQTVLETRNAVIARHVRGDSILGRRNSEGVIETTSVICAPIFTDAKRWGLVHVYSTDLQMEPDEQDLDFTIGVAEILSITLENLKQQSVLATRLNIARDENADLRKRLGVQSEIVGSSPTVADIMEQIVLAANSRATVLIRGESGVGKELVARGVHYSSPRKKEAFICLNCAALAEDLLASELFGHEKGAFTGATDRKIGKFEAADGGTLMLDEIGEMSMNIQAKFLRVLEGHPFERVGGNKPIKVDVRVIAATNRDLEQEVLAGRFRKDLFFRLRVVEILVPPLRERQSDVPQLAEHFFRQFRNETGRKLHGFSHEAMEKLCSYSWPGNIRELKNVIERAVVLARGEQIEPNDLLLSNLSAPFDTLAPLSNASGESFRPLSLEDVELEHIRRTLEYTSGNKSKAAQLLGIERTTLDRKIRKIENK